MPAFLGIWGRAFLHMLDLVLAFTLTNSQILLSFLLPASIV
jgi:hypothetical protein